MMNNAPQIQETTISGIPYRTCRKTDPTTGEAVWPAELENCLVEALLTLYHDKEFGSSNRCAFISEYIKLKTGKNRTPSQVSSRLQQLRRGKNPHLANLVRITQRQSPRNHSTLPSTNIVPMQLGQNLNPYTQNDPFSPKFPSPSTNAFDGHRTFDNSPFDALHIEQQQQQQQQWYNELYYTKDPMADISALSLGNVQSEYDLNAGLDMGLDERHMDFTTSYGEGGSMDLLGHQLHSACSQPEQNQNQLAFTPTPHYAQQQPQQQDLMSLDANLDYDLLAALMSPILPFSQQMTYGATDVNTTFS